MPVILLLWFFLQSSWQPIHLWNTTDGSVLPRQVPSLLENLWALCFFVEYTCKTSPVSQTPLSVSCLSLCQPQHCLLPLPGFCIGYTCGLYMTYSKAGWLLHRKHHYRVYLHIKKTCGNLLHLSVKCNLFWVVFYWANMRNFPCTYKHTQLKVQNKSYFCVSLSSLLSSYPFHLGRTCISVKPFYHTERSIYNSYTFLTIHWHFLLLFNQFPGKLKDSHYFPYTKSSFHPTWKGCNSWISKKEKWSAFPSWPIWYLAKFSSADIQKDGGESKAVSGRLSTEDEVRENEMMAEEEILSAS